MKERKRERERERKTQAFTLKGYLIAPVFPRASVNAKGMLMLDLLCEAVTPVGCRPGQNTARP